MRKNHCFKLSCSTLAPDLHEKPLASTYTWHLAFYESNISSKTSYLLVRQHGLVYRVIIDKSFSLVSQSLFVEHEKNSLGVFIEIWRTSHQFL